MDARRVLSKCGYGGYAGGGSTTTEGYASGGKLTAAARERIPTGSFALSGRRYPINDASHARNALARVSQFGSPAEKSRVRAAVHRRYPGIGK